MEAIINALHSSNPEELDILARHSDPQVRRATASNDNSSIATLRRLESDSDRHVRMTAVTTMERHELARSLKR